MHQHLFAYGTLEHLAHKPHEDATVEGELRFTPDGWAAADFGRDGTIHGKLMPVYPEELPALDAREDGYRRIMVTTDRGTQAWAYQWVNPAEFDRMGRIPSGVWKPITE